MDELPTNSLNVFEMLDLLDDFNDLVEKITSDKTPEPVKTELMAAFDVLASLLGGKPIPSARKKLKLAKELSKIIDELEHGNIKHMEKEKLAIRKEIIIYLLSSTDERKKAKIFSVLNRSNQNLKYELKEKLDNINPFSFERIIAKLLSFLGYVNVETTKKSRDGGIDIVAHSDIERLHSIKTVVQVKRIKANVGTPVVDNLRGAMNACGADRGLIITTSDFTKDCRKSTENNNALKVHLINGNELVDLLIQHEVGITSKNITVYSIDNDFLNSI